MPEYIFCYDISDAKRLRKAAKILQGQALRIQKSVYLCGNTNDHAPLLAAIK